MFYCPITGKVMWDGYRADDKLAALLADGLQAAQ
jgi:hypothetical protein